MLYYGVFIPLFNSFRVAFYRFHSSPSCTRCYSNSTPSELGCGVFIQRKSSTNNFQQTKFPLRSTIRLTKNHGLFSIVYGLWSINQQDQQDQQLSTSLNNQINQKPWSMVYFLSSMVYGLSTNKTINYSFY